MFENMLFFFLKITLMTETSLCTYSLHAIYIRKFIKEGYNTKNTFWAQYLQQLLCHRKLH